jgi:diacylglycerol kinase family enzyme
LTHTVNAAYQVPDGDVAVILNANAGRVRARLARSLRQAAPGAIVYWTRSMDEAEDALESALESGVTTLFGGGGDGTIIDLANRMVHYANPPRLGVLKLGTGNALATWVGARTPVEDLAGWAAGEAFTELPLRLVHAEDDFFPFAGLGWDAAVLNDYRWAKQQMKQTPLEGFSHQLWVYVASAFGRTVPRMATRPDAPRATVEVLEGEAWRVDRHGDRIGAAVGPGSILYDGPAHMTAVGTTPYYGYAMRMLPHACVLDSHMHLRVSALSLPQVVNELPRIWSGEYEHERLYDFLAQKVRVTFDEEVPYQVGGDARGMRRSLELAVAPARLPVLSFTPPG